MKQQEAKEIIECLPRDRTLFYYYKDRYAAWILESITQQGEKISDLKKSCYGGLLKSISGRLPPRSLYTDLPRKFCFQKTVLHPEFLLKDRYFKKQLRVHKNRNLQWQLLNLETSHAQI